MKSITRQWFICKIKYDKVHEDGLVKSVVEQYVVDALSFTEAEARIMEEMAQYISGDFAVEDISKASFGEIFFSCDSMADRWYKAKLDFITINEASGKEKRSKVTYLVQAATLDGALRNVHEVMNGTTIDYESVLMQETPYMDVFLYEKSDKPEVEA